MEYAKFFYQVLPRLNVERCLPPLDVQDPRPLTFFVDGKDAFRVMLKEKQATLFVRRHDQQEERTLPQALKDAGIQHLQAMHESDHPVLEAMGLAVNVEPSYELVSQVLDMSIQRNVPKSRAMDIFSHPLQAKRSLVLRQCVLDGWTSQPAADFPDNYALVSELDHASLHDGDIHILDPHNLVYIHLQEGLAPDVHYLKGPVPRYDEVVAKFGFDPADQIFSQVFCPEGVADEEFMCVGSVLNHHGDEEDYLNKCLDEARSVVEELEPYLDSDFILLNEKNRTKQVAKLLADLKDAHALIRAKDKEIRLLKAANEKFKSQTEETALVPTNVKGFVTKVVQNFCRPEQVPTKPQKPQGKVPKRAPDYLIDVGYQVPEHMHVRNGNRAKLVTVPIRVNQEEHKLWFSERDIAANCFVTDDHAARYFGFFY